MVDSEFDKQHHRPSDWRLPCGDGKKLGPMIPCGWCPRRRAARCRRLLEPAGTDVDEIATPGRAVGERHGNVLLSSGVEIRAWVQGPASQPTTSIAHELAKGKSKETAVAAGLAPGLVVSFNCPALHLRRAFQIHAMDSEVGSLSGTFDWLSRSSGGQASVCGIPCPLCRPTSHGKLWPLQMRPCTAKEASSCSRRESHSMSEAEDPFRGMRFAQHAHESQQHVKALQWAARIPSHPCRAKNPRRPTVRGLVVGARRAALSAPRITHVL
jgi:hypothetical protein